ncbi:energy transducer TonB [Dechloromonas sp. ZY10]|uniref:energy transducer TonB n=1 Tax=Dechloromonas aquae TaxID=2664436 RepID=UPI003528C01B
MSRPPPLPFAPSERRLMRALAASLLAHAVLLLPPQPKAPVRPPALPPLQARLQPPPVAPLAVPELRLESEQTAVRTQPPPPPVAARRPPPERSQPQRSDWREKVRQHLQQLQQQGLFYPPEAIARGEQGEVVVLLILAEDGQVAAARVEQGSGHPLLDAAALRAVRSLHALPADAPRETLLPVRFRLR